MESPRICRAKWGGGGGGGGGWKGTKKKGGGGGKGAVGQPLNNRWPRGHITGGVAAQAGPFHYFENEQGRLN